MHPSKLRKDVTKLQLCTPSHILVALSGLLDRLEQRYGLKGITMFRYMGHQYDARLLKRCLEVDFVDYRGCQKYLIWLKMCQNELLNQILI